MKLGASDDIIDRFPPADEVFARLQDRSASVGRGDKQLRKPGSIHPKLGQQSARLNYPATLNSFRRCLKVIDTFRGAKSRAAQQLLATTVLM